MTSQTNAVQPVPVTILLGFLGSDKTTIERNLRKQEIIETLDSCLVNK